MTFTNKLTIFILLTVSCVTFAKLDKEYADDYHVVEAVFLKEHIGVAIIKGDEKELLFYEISRKDKSTKKINAIDFKRNYDMDEKSIRKLVLPSPFTGTDFVTDDGRKISYKLNSCIYNSEKEYLNPYAICKSITISINGKHYHIKKEFFSWLKLLEPVLWKQYLIFKGVVPASKGNSGRRIPEHNIGIEIFDLDRTKYVAESTNAETVFAFGVYDHNHTNFTKVDNNGNFFWIGGRYGLYAVDETLVEKISCYFLKDKKNNFVDFKCAESDYILNSKPAQAEALEKKAEAIKKGFAPPEDTERKMKNALQCQHSLGKQINDDVREDTDPNKYYNIKYKAYMECSLLGPESWQEIAKDRLRKMDELNNKKKVK